MKSKFVNIEAEIVSESAISSIRSHHQPQNRLIFSPIQQRPFTRSTIVSHHRQEKEKRQSISIFLFVMANFSFVVLAFQEIPLFFIQNCPPKTVYGISSLILITIVMLGTSIYFVGWKQMFFIYFLLDTILLAWIASMIGLLGMLNVFQLQFPFFANILKYLGPISSFCTAGAVRVLIKHANFKKWQNIIFKISIIADAICYFGIGVYTMYTDFQASAGTVPSIDVSYKDFNLLFVFGGLSFFKQMLNLHNRFDRTGKLTYKYKLTDQIQDQEDIEGNREGEGEDLKTEIQYSNQQETQNDVNKKDNHNELQGYFQKRLSQQKKRENSTSIQIANKSKNKNNELLNQN